MKVPYKRGPYTYHMSHMFADTISEIHRMAGAIGVKRVYFQQPPKASWPHYDIAETKRQQAISLGAIVVPYGPKILPYADLLMIQWCLENNRQNVLTDSWLDKRQPRHSIGLREYLEQLKLGKTG